MLKKEKITEIVDYEFMPDLVIMTEKPDSPLGSTVIWLISSLIVITFLFSIFYKIDTVASAKGKLIPKGKLNVIITPDSGVIEKIYVKEGQEVKKNDLLLTFDSDISASDLSDTKKVLDIQCFEKELLEEELYYIFGDENNRKIDNRKFENIGIKEREIYVEQKKERIKEYNNKINKFQLSIKQKEDEKKMLLLSLTNLINKDKLIKMELDNLKKQLNAGLIPEFNVESKLIEDSILKEEINIQKLKLDSSDKAIEEAIQGIILYKNEKKNWLLNEIIIRKKNIDNLENKLIKETKKHEFQKLTAPLDGIINKISANNSGGFVGQGQELITIVPKNTILEAEVYISNNDIGFVRNGQEAIIKLDTFPFQDYGYLKGRLRVISPDSEMIEGDLYYKAYVSITENKLRVPNNQKEVIAGMSLKADIQTEKRRIIDFFLSPFKKSLQESLNLR